MDKVTVSAQQRSGVGTKAASDLRAAGQVPAVLYGAGQTTQNITVPTRDMLKIIRELGVKAVVELAVEGGSTTTARLQEVQRTKVTRELLHLDFQVV